MNPAIDTSGKGIAASKRGLKNLLQKMFKRSRENQPEESSVCKSTFPDSTCSSHETMTHTRSTKKDESLENSRNVTYIKKLKENNVGVHEEYSNIREWHEVPGQWEIIDGDIPEMGTEALEYEPEKPTANELELEVYAASHDFNEQEIEVNPESNDVNEQEKYVNRESGGDNECSAGLNNSSRMEDQEVCQASSPPECSVTSEPWEYQYEKYMKMYSRISERAEVPKRHGENESLADFKSSSLPVKRKAARFVCPLKYHLILRKWKYQSKIRRIFLLETLTEELEESTGNEVDRVNPNNIENSRPLTVLKYANSFGDAALQNYSFTLKTFESQSDNIISTCSKTLKEESTDIEQERVVEPVSLEDKESLPILDNVVCVNEWGESQISDPQKCSAPLEERVSQIENIANMCSRTMEKEPEELTDDEKPDNPEENDSSPVLENTSCVKVWEFSGAVASQKCSTTLDTIINTCTDLQKMESEEPKYTEKEIVVNQESVEHAPVFEKTGCMKKHKSLEATAPQKCYVTLEKWETQYENIINANSETLQTESEEVNNDKKTVFNPDSPEESKSSPVLENVGCMKKLGVYETVASQRCSTTLAKTESQYNDNRYVYSKPLEMESKESTGNEEETLMNPDNMEENESFFCFGNAGFKKTKIYSKDIVADTYFVNVEEMITEYENIINVYSEKLKHESKEARVTDKKIVMNPDSLEESVSLFFSETSRCANNYGASEVVALWKCSASLKERKSQYENRVSLCSETLANEWKESTNNEKQRNIHPDNLEENKSPPVFTGCEKEWGDSETVASQRCSTTLEKKESQYENIILNTYLEIVKMESVKSKVDEQEIFVNPDKLEENDSSLFIETFIRGSETLKKDSKKPTAENEQKGIVNSEGFGEIDHSNDRKNVIFRLERDASQSVICHEGFLMRQMLFVSLYFMAIIFILWVQNNKMFQI